MRRDLSQAIHRHAAQRGEGRRVLGLCKGFADYTDIPVGWVRFMMIILDFTVIGAIGYLIVGLILDHKAKKNGTK